MSTRKVILYISMSLDGYLAGPNDDLSFLNAVMMEGEDYGYGEFTSGVDTYIVGRKTYEVVMGMINDFPQAQQYNCYILTRTAREPENGVTFYSSDLEALISRLKSEPGKNIYCDGGAEIVRLFMEKHLIDEYIISIIPTILGDGKKLFMGGTPPENIELVGSKSFDSGLVQVHYRKK